MAGSEGTHEERDEAEVGADGDPDRSERVLDESKRQVDDRDGEGEHSDDPWRALWHVSIAALKNANEG